MTQKELLYVENAYGHEKNIISILEETINNLKDENLISFIEKEIKKHKTMQDKLMSLLEGKENE